MRVGTREEVGEQMGREGCEWVTESVRGWMGDRVNVC